MAMKNLAQRLQQHLPLSARLLVSTAAMAAVLAAGVFPTRTMAQTGSKSASPAARISAEISGSERSQLPGSQHPLAQATYDSGRVAAGTRLQGISIYFSRTQSQEADLQKLLAAQQDPSSSQYHKWLTPEQFASRFGMADADIAKVQSWLEQQGFSVDSVARSKNMIRFSGTVGQVESAFSTEMHNYNVNGAKHFAPSTALSVPSALAGVVNNVRNLDDFRPKAHVVASRTRGVKPSFTSSVSGSVFFAPGDISTVYDVQPVYQAGFTGTGQSIAIVGQSAVALTDLEAFQSAASLTVKDPTQVLVPGTGSPEIFTGDEVESDLDLEWSGAMAPGATIYFVYTGSNTNYGTFDSLVYAIDNQIGTIISSSYGECEADLGGQNLESSLEQAASQGQTVISAAGDSGSTDCFVGNNVTNPSLSVQETEAVDYPASSQYVTGLGGTEISTSSSSYVTPGDGYWETASSSDVISSAIKYIPEIVWNEDTAGCGTADCLSSGGGGASTLFTKPTWQTGVTGIPTANHRYVPDISLNSATGLPGYLFCTSDTSFWNTGQVASCNSGFRDATTGDLTIAGGTSFAAPIFAGMLALINQDKGYTSGQGLINSMLYTLASNSSTYASAFHDITSGNNDCLAGSSYCSSTAGFSATTGYDEASGLGSLDLANLVGVWAANTGTALIDTTTSVQASDTAPAVNASVTFTITVTPATPAPTGTVTITVDSNTPITGQTLSSNGTLTYTTTFSTAGTHQILAHFMGDSTYATSTGSATVNVAGTSSGTGSFKLAATNLTVSQGSTGSSTITVTPAGGYTGTVDIGFDTSNDSALQNLCYSFTNTLSSGDGSVTVSGTAAVTTQLTFDTNAVDCATSGAVQKSGKHAFRSMHKVSSNTDKGSGGLKTTSAAMAFAGLLLAGFLGRSSRRLRGLACLIVLAAIGMAVTACGGSSSTTVSDPPKGTYTVSLSGSDTSSTSVPTATTSFTFTIQ
jgi:subtilase family serine protease